MWILSTYDHHIHTQLYVISDYGLIVIFDRDFAILFFNPFFFPQGLLIEMTKMPPEDKMRFVSVDELLTHVGEYGRLQKLINCVFCIMTFPPVYQVMIRFTQPVKTYFPHLSRIFCPNSGCWTSFPLSMDNIIRRLYFYILKVFSRKYFGNPPPIKNHRIQSALQSAIKLKLKLAQILVRYTRNRP